VKTTAYALSGVLYFVSAVAGAADSSCPADDGVLGSELWLELIRVVEENYLAPRDLDVTALSSRQWAKILGHGLGRQAHYVGDDARRRSLFACLEKGLTEALSSVSVAHVGLQEYKGESASEILSRVAREATIGFHDEEVSKLTGVGPTESIPSVFAEALRVPESPDPASGVGGQAEVKSQPSPGRCRFNLHPSLYTSAHAAFVWYLVRQPRGRGGYYYDTVAVNPEWGPDHRKRPENRLKPGQEILVQGSKTEILERIRELRKDCF
jgi:hypothetical protein